MHALRIRADKIGAILQKKDNSSIKLIGNRYAEIELEEQKKKILTSKLNKQRSYRKLVLISGVIFVLFVLFGVMRMPHMILPISKNRLTPTASMAEIITNTESLPIVTMQPIYVFDLVLPCGHTPPDNQGNTRPNESEIPENYRYLMLTPQVISTLPATTKQAVRIQIPAIHVDAPIVQGDSWEQLKKGVGQRIGSVYPGDLGNIVLCAYNDIYGEIFRYLDQLKRGMKLLYIQRKTVIYIWLPVLKMSIQR